MDKCFVVWGLSYIGRLKVSVHEGRAQGVQVLEAEGDVKGNMEAPSLPPVEAPQ